MHDHFYFTNTNAKNVSIPRGRIEFQLTSLKHFQKQKFGCFVVHFVNTVYLLLSFMIAFQKRQNLILSQIFQQYDWVSFKLFVHLFDFQYDQEEHMLDFNSQQSMELVFYLNCVQHQILSIQITYIRVFSCIYCGPKISS
eukprot:TRINITY_DN7523_c0_g1_i1.p1 TRINITY_DN7523_c0_g1~~TRINITY_DN7523_c0_g1_i1.p1  ORF type:complete len:140 (+),score=0.92 TRINITY_DN7523_c0_g1_i1:342-761(+)